MWGRVGGGIPRATRWLNIILAVRPRQGSLSTLTGRAASPPLVRATCAEPSAKWRVSTTTNPPRLSMEPLRLPHLADLPLDQLDGSRLLDLDPGTIVQTLREGVPTEALERLQGVLDVPTREIAAVLGIPPRTLTRRRNAERLASDESDRLLRLARLVEIALVVLEDEESARAWLLEPKRLLGGESPLRHADTDPGARAVEDMLYAIEFTTAA